MFIQFINNATPFFPKGLSFQRIDPFQLGEASKIRVCGSYRAAMFQGKGRNMRVCNQVGDGLAIIKHLLKCSPMLLGRSDDSCARLVEPALYAGQGLFKGKRVFEYSRVGPDADKRRQNSPAQANRLAPGQLIIPPFSSIAVKWG